ncbi:hypothetical protein GJR96_11370 [Haloferax sp. MBLA0076]|uniref:Uncharacterized protein n=1 Tax=Haloferax litoreum TaxID=2666140 RepID=A0A6A8GLI9_9EURY|nr:MULTISPECIES: hypothetical protein [Haloferax]KAB1194002.1 hypothetical protein Hfx1148_11325 [Haloferax sp. CBA1148]MRX22550.1 hypothetical protein [Haloferax litoreum]
MTNTEDTGGPTRRRFLRTSGLLVGGLAIGVGATGTVAAGVPVANGWYEGEEIYYVAHGVEEGVTERGENDIYLIGGDRVWQAQVVEFIPGESGYSPHWNVNLVKTETGVTVADIVASPYVSEHYPEALFDDVEDIRAAEDAGLVTISKPGAVVLCPIVPERVADAPGNTELSEDFPRPWPETF